MFLVEFIVAICVLLQQCLTTSQSNLTTGPIATAHRRYSLYFTTHRLLSHPQNYPLPMEDLDFIYMVSWAHPSPERKRHLDLFSRVCRAHYYDRQTDGQITLLGR